MSLRIGAGKHLARKNSKIKEQMRTNQVAPRYSKLTIRDLTNFNLKDVSTFRIQVHKAIQVISKALLHLLILTIDFKSRKNLKKGKRDLQAIKREITPI